MKTLVWVLLLLPTSAIPRPGLAQNLRSIARNDEPATEAELRAAVESIEQVGRELQIGLKTYRTHLQAALQQQGYGPYHPLFRTTLNGFEQDQIDLDDLDQFKMGRLAFELKSAGTMLMPDPFDDWLKVQRWLGAFESAIDLSRRVVARANILFVHSDKNIPPAALQKLRKRWRMATNQATGAYEHGMAVRAVQFSGGEMVPAEANVRRIFRGGRYGVICAFSVCTSQPANDSEENQRAPLVH